MAVVYTTLIVKGFKQYKDVPAILKNDVRALLEALDLGHLAVE